MRSLKSLMVFSTVFPLLAVLTLAGPIPTESSAAAAKPTTVKVGMIPIAAHLPYFTAIEKGFFAEEGLKVQSVTIFSAPKELEALAARSIQIGIINVASFLMAASRGFDIKMVAMPYHNDCTRPPGAPGSGYSGAAAVFMVMKGSPIRSAKDLEGKKVGIFGVKSLDWFLAAEWMRKKGADVEKVIWLEAPFPKLPSLLTSGQVVAADMAEPFKTELLAQGKADILDAYFCVAKENTTMAFFAALSPWIKNNGETLNKFVRAINKGVDYVTRHREERAQIGAKYTRVKAEVLRNMTWHQWRKKADLEDLQWWIELLNKYKELGKPLTARDLIHTTVQ